MPASCRITKKVSSGFCGKRVSGPAFLSCQPVAGSPRRWSPGSPDRRQPASCAFKRHARTSPRKGALGPWVYFGTEALFPPRIVGQGRIMPEKRHRRPATAAARLSNCRNMPKGGQLQAKYKRARAGFFLVASVLYTLAKAKAGLILG